MKSEDSEELTGETFEIGNFAKDALGVNGGRDSNDLGILDTVEALNQFIAKTDGLWRKPLTEEQTQLNASATITQSPTPHKADQVCRPQTVPQSTSWDVMFPGWSTDKKSMELIAAILPSKDKTPFYHWWGGYQEIISWEDYKKNGFNPPSQQDHTLKERLDTKNPDQTANLTSGNINKTSLPTNAYLSTSLARTSPFWPVSRAIPKDRNERIFHNKVEIVNNWGETVIDGPLMTIPDEGVLLALTHISVDQKTNNIKTTLSQICKLLGKSRGVNQYNAIRTSIIILGLNRVVTCIYKDTDHENTEVLNGLDANNEIEPQSIKPTNNISKKKQIQKIQVGTILTGEVDAKSTTVQLTLNDFFLEQYRKGLSTSIDLNKWSNLRSDIAKALHRFISSHAEFRYPFDILTLCKAINLNTNQSIKRIRQILKQAFSELKRVEIADCILSRNDQVHITIIQSDRKNKI